MEKPTKVNTKEVMTNRGKFLQRLHDICTTLSWSKENGSFACQIYNGEKNYIKIRMTVINDKINLHVVFYNDLIGITVTEEDDSRVLSIFNDVVSFYNAKQTDLKWKKAFDILF